MDCPICKAPGMCICPPAQARAVNILTPAALDNAELAYVHAVAEAVRAGETDSEKITKVGLQAAFNAAIAKLIAEGQAWKEDCVELRIAIRKDES